MDQQFLFEPIPNDKYDSLTKEELIILHKGEQDLIRQMQAHIKELYREITKGEQKSFSLGEQLFKIKNSIFGKSSEKSKINKNKKKKKEPKKRVRLPSERYKNLDIIEKDVEFDKVPNCPCCSSKMKDSGLFDTCEYLTFIPRKYYVVREKKHKYSCGKCYQGLITTPAIPRIIPGGAYSDEMIIDVTMTKFLDLLPIDRYTKIAEREGLEGLPANSLINTTHKLADLVEPVYKIIKTEALNEDVTHADETPHRMLEGDKTSKWYMWGFSNLKASYFDIRDTRSGDVACDLLVDAKTKYLMSDVFSGYKRAVREANENRVDKIIELNCNAHARRKFKDSAKNFDESEYFLKVYRKIYHLEDDEYCKKLTKVQKRKWQNIYMKLMQRYALKIQHQNPKKSSIQESLNYFLNNFEKLSRFVEDPKLPLDNNSQERQLRSPVIGRKTWYGTHSKRGAKTTAIMFSIVQSCKINKINPRKYLTELVRGIHQGVEFYSPYQFKLKNQDSK